MTPPVRFGVLGAGRIAQEAFAPAVHQARNAVLAAAASRDRARAEALGPQRVHADYEALLADSEVDAVYIATHNGLHRDLTLQALAAGKHVLCEKPLGRDPAECEEMIAAARGAGRHLVEAFMYRHHPQWKVVQEWLEAGRIGRLMTVEASFSFHLTRPDDVRLRKEWGGGALMDVGCYCVNVCRLFLGDVPESVIATGHFHPEHDVDLSLHGVLDYGEGRYGVISCGFDSGLRNRVLLSGTEGIVEVPSAFIGWREDTEVILRAGDTVERHSTPATDLFQAEIEDLARAIQEDGKPMLPPEEALANARILERLLAAARGRA